MNKEEAIKYLQQLYPNGGHCWLDEQRIEAISMAVKALQEEPNDVVDKYLYGKDPEFVDEDDLPTKKDYRERYKRIAESEEFRKNHDGMSVGDIVPVEGEEPVSEDLEEFINTLSKRYPEVSFAKLSRIAVHVAKWQREQTLDKACNFLGMLGQGFTITDEITHNTYNVEQLMIDFKKYMED